MVGVVGSVVMVLSGRAGHEGVAAAVRGDRCDNRRREDEDEVSGRNGVWSGVPHGAPHRAKQKHKHDLIFMFVLRFMLILNFMFVFMLFFISC